ncbi:MAG: tRNA-queuosine alpha-mannosyltransferase domain-containing protein [Marinobacter sp.]
MANPKSVLLLSGYDAGSHRRWREQLMAGLPEHRWQVLALPPRFFRWRIRGNPLSWLGEPQLQERWDLILATSMVDLATLKGLNPQLARTPAILYMHENQFAYPDSGQQHSSAEPSMVNLYSALAADRVLFNSAWNRDSFLDGACCFIDRMPDHLPPQMTAAIREKARVVPVPIDDRLFVDRTAAHNFAQPHLLWNHRWEYDKGPERLLNLLRELRRRRQPFRLSVVGEQFRRRPAAFGQIRAEFGDRLVHWGFLEQRADYDHLLANADIVVSTALHDFQGLAMLEAMASGCLALAPHRLAYPEYVPAGQCYGSYPDDPAAEARAAADSLQALLHQRPAPFSPGRWRTSTLVAQYRRQIDEVSGASR